MLLLLFPFFTAVSTKDIPPFANHLTDDNLVEYVNFKQNLFKAARCNFTEEQKKARVMTGIFAEAKKRANPAEVIDWINEDSIPSSFDSRTQWSSCATISTIYDQGNCGSCWAFCTAETMSDRTCIATSQQVALSPYDVLTCCTSCGNGCNGGWPVNAFNYWTTTGVCTNGCKPYFLPPTGCSSTCSSSSHSPSYQNDLHYGTGQAYSMPNGGVTAIQQEIMAHGPVSATFSVYGDFYQYTSGIYVHTGGAYYGRHCVKVVGWGVKNGTPYWTVANSWGASWGEHGFFRIIRGRNEVGFESDMAAALPRV